jgi:hypothetical protein
MSNKGAKIMVECKELLKAIENFYKDETWMHRDIYKEITGRGNWKPEEGDD